MFDGRTLSNVDETHPYAVKPMDYYTQTKVIGERLVLAANGKLGVATCALRPSGIFGEGDPLFVPTVAKQVRWGHCLHDEVLQRVQLRVGCCRATVG